MEGAFVGYEHRFARSAWEVHGSEVGSLWGRASLRSTGVGKRLVAVRGFLSYRASLRSPGFDQDCLAGIGAICFGGF